MKQLAKNPSSRGVELIHNDCRQALPALPDNSVHMVLTDPPYFLDGLDENWKKGGQTTKRATGAVGGLPVGMKFDARQGEKLQSFMKDIACQLRRVLVPGGFVLSFSQPRLSHRMAMGMEAAGFEIRDVYAWHYTHRAQMKAFSQNHFVDKMSMSIKEKEAIKRCLQGRKTPQLRPQFETIIVAQNPRDGTFVNNWLKYKTGLIDTTQTLDGTAPQTVMTVEKPQGNERNHTHLTPKPLRLLKHLVELFTLPNQIVLDPFLGSGSTAVAAQATNRKCIGIEINKMYFDMAKKRIVDACQAS